jgi:hypothetical protein
VKNEFKVNGKDLLNKIEEIIKEGNIRRIIIKNDEGKTFIEIPLTIGIIGVLAAPVMAAVGALAGIVANFTVEVIRKENVKDDNSEVVDFTEIKTED